MRWSKLNTKTGDDGLSHFGTKRIPKCNKVFDIVGEIDMLNAQIGMGKRHDMFLTSEELQEMNRQIMGSMHTLMIVEPSILEKIDGNLETCTKYLDSGDRNIRGWMNYNNQWGVVCCQVRNVERHIVDYVKNIGPKTILTDVIRDGHVVQIYNRMSKLFFVYHAICSV